MVDLPTYAESFAAMYAEFEAATNGRKKVGDALRFFVAVVATEQAINAGYRDDCTVRVRLDDKKDARGVRHMEISVSTRIETDTHWESRTELRVAFYPGIPAQITVKRYRFGADPTMNTKNAARFIRGLAAEMNWRWNP